MNNMYRTAVLIVTGFLTVACNSAAGDWDKATAANTLAAYQAFLQNHSTNTHAGDAQARIAQLQDDADWSMAQSENSEKSYGDYLQQHATGAHVAAAHDHLTSLQRAVAWKSAKDAGTAVAMRTFLEKYPQGFEADEAKQKLAALESYRVQLEATRSKSAAERKLKFAKQHFGKELRDVEIASPNPPDTLYRVMSGAMSHDDASSACQALQRAHEACEVVGAG
jgi:hypothetical protein